MISPMDKTKKVLKATLDPVYFCIDPYFLGLEPTPKQAEIIRTFYRDEDFNPTKYNELVVMAGMRGGKCIAGDCWVTNAKTNERYMIKDVHHHKLHFPIHAWCNNKIYFAYDWVISKDGFRIVYELKTNKNKSVKVTRDHKVLTNKGWIYPIQLEGWPDGLKLACYDGTLHYENLESVEKLPACQTYDFFVKHYHTLVCNGIVVHNTFLGSCFALYEAFKLLILDDPATYYKLAPGSEIFIMNVATSERQALDTVFAQIKSKFDRSPFFQSQTYKTYSDEIRFLDKHVNVRSMSSSSASGVGRTAKAVIFDELSRFQETSGQRSGWEVYYSLSRATRTFGLAGKRFVIGSPLHQNDIIHTLYERAKTHSNMLGYHLPTWELNPNITFESLRDELERDPIAFWRDYGAEPAYAIETYFRDGSILKVNPDRPNVLQMLYDNLEPKAGPHTYILAGDPALKHDAFGLALGHREEDHFIIDGLFRFDPLREVDPFLVRDFILKIHKHFPFIYVVFDTWNFPEVLKRVSQEGVVVLNHTVRKEDYDRVKELLYRGQLDICNYPFVLEELRYLEVKNQIKVDHPKGHSKDVADALCNVVYVLSEEIPMPKFHFVEVI